MVQVRQEGVGAFKQGCGSDLYIGEYRRCINEEREHLLPSSNECVICLDAGSDDDTYAVCRLTLHVAPCSFNLAFARYLVPVVRQRTCGYCSDLITVHEACFMEWMARQGGGGRIQRCAGCAVAAVSQSFPGDKMHGYGILHTRNATSGMTIAGAWSRGFHHGHNVCRKASLEDDGEIRVGYRLFDQGQLVHEACEAVDGTCTFDCKP